MDVSNQQITQEIFRKYMHSLLVRCKQPLAGNADIYHAIYEGTLLMCATLRQLGYAEGINLFEELCLAPRPEKSHSLIASLN